MEDATTPALPDERLTMDCPHCRAEQDDDSEGQDWNLLENGSREYLQLYECSACGGGFDVHVIIRKSGKYDMCQITRTERAAAADPAP